MKPNPGRTSAILLLMLTLALRSTAQAAGGPTVELFVSPTGSDANPGTKSKPFATLEAARDAARAQKTAKTAPGADIRIWLRAGDYLRTGALLLDARDSGTPGHPVVWGAYRDEKVRLLGGRVLNGFAPVKDQAILDRLDPKARGQVLSIDLRSMGITRFGEMKSRGFARPTAPSHCELFFAGRPMDLARWPNEGGWEKIAGFPAGSGRRDEHGGTLGELAGGFTYSGDRPRRWKDVSQLWVHGYWAWDWANSYEKVVGLDTEKRLVLTAPPYANYGFRAGQRFCFLNVLEELDQPGEWYLDSRAGVLYFWPPSPMAGKEALLSLLDEPLVEMKDVSHLRIQSCTLEGTRSSGLVIRGGNQAEVAGCVLRNLGDLGVVIEGGTEHVVRSCDILDTGDGGVSMSGGDRATLSPGSHVVENCHFEHQGRWSKCYVPAVLLNGVGHRVSHNLIHDHPHCAILYNGNDHLIEFNEIHHIALETGDVGAIYAGRDYTYRGNRIIHNFIHHTGGVGMGSMGVYMDDCVSGTEIFGNVFYKVHWAAFIGGGRDHRVENNIFVDCDPAVRMDGRGMDKTPVWRDMVYVTMKNSLAAMPSELYRRRYPAIKTLDAAFASDAGIPPANNSVIRNLCVGKWLEVGWHAKQEQVEVRDNVVTEDGRFMGADKMDFRLRSDSPVWRVGFRPLPFEDIGLKVDPYRRQVVKH